MTWLRFRKRCPGRSRGGGPCGTSIPARRSGWRSTLTTCSQMRWGRLRCRPCWPLLTSGKSARWTRSRGDPSRRFCKIRRIFSPFLFLVCVCVCICASARGVRRKRGEIKHFKRCLVGQVLGVESEGGVDGPLDPNRSLYLVAPSFVVLAKPPGGAGHPPVALISELDRFPGNAVAGRDALQGSVRVESRLVPAGQDQSWGSDCCRELLLRYSAVKLPVDLATRVGPDASVAL
mmetsp:Transcript_4153/g.14503  ORF Transcript_4153/g.14503 Transcript_4153/m.14503 type:complete len:233 (+) Transcript_4153:1971-2669(+)